MFYESKKDNPIKIYRVLSCVLYSIIDNYVCIEYLCCHSKTLSVISYDKIFEEASYNGLLSIGIPKVLINLLYFHGFMKKQNSTVMLVCQSRLVNYYLAKVFVGIEHNSNHLSSVPNYLKLRINLIDKPKKRLSYGVHHINFLISKYQK